MPNPITNFRDSFGTDLGNKLITKEYLMSVYPQIANQLTTPELWVWGQNSVGQLGDNSATNRSTPVTTLAGGANWKQVDCGGNHTVAIKTDGSLWTWGFASFGRLGTNDTTDRSTPVTTFNGGTNWKQVSAAGSATAAIKTDGTLWVWGDNFEFVLGINNSADRLTPVTTFAGGNNWKQVSCGSNHMSAIKTDGTLWVWGTNNAGKLGTNDATNRSTPSQTSVGGTNWKQVACGLNHMSAIKTDGTLWTWGSNSYGQLGINATIPRSTPVQTSAGGTNWKQVACAGNSTAAIKTDGTLWTWGVNGSGILGINNTTSRSTPVTTFAGGNNWKQVAADINHMAAIKTDGTLWTFGTNSSGQRGTNNNIESFTPVTTFAGGTNWKQVACGNGFTCAIETSDDLQGI